MLIAGGISFDVIYLLSNNKSISSNIIKAIICALIITIIELIIGIITNLKFKLNIWNYSSLKYNYKGQICLKYSFYWGLLSFISINILKLF